MSCFAVNGNVKTLRFLSESIIEDGKYYIEFRYGNKINNYKKCLSSELLEDKEGNLYADFMNQGIGYDPKQDLLLVEDYGAFKRKMETEHEK